MPDCLNPVDRFRALTLGAETQYITADGKQQQRLYFDSAASALSLSIVHDIYRAYAPFSANTHSHVHHSAAITEQALKDAHQVVLAFVSANPKQYQSLFISQGSTSCINQLAQMLQPLHPEKDIVLCSIMEHHSNDLPHRKFAKEVIHIPNRSTPSGSANLDLDALENELKTHAKKVKYIAVTAASNVTGIINPLKQISSLARQYGCLLLVDAAQMIPHKTIDLNQIDADMLVFSGHKLYAPGTPGVIVIKQALLESMQPAMIGGGTVHDVTTNHYELLSDSGAIHQAGTPDIPGIIALAAVMLGLEKIGRSSLIAHEEKLLSTLIAALQTLPELVIYGTTDIKQYPRTGVVSINIRGMHHALLAKILNDYFAIETRNACFCAHPYVRDMITQDLAQQFSGNMDQYTPEALETLANLHRGMVRISLSPHHSQADISRLLTALTQIIKNHEQYQSDYLYHADSDTFEHKSFHIEPHSHFDLKRVTEQLIHTDLLSK